MILNCSKPIQISIDQAENGLQQCPLTSRSKGIAMPKQSFGPSFLECHRYYGSNTKSESINWTAFSLNSVPSLTKKHDVTVIAANNDLSGSTMKFIQMNSRCKAGQIPGSTNGGSNEPVTEFVSEVSNGIDVANVDVMLALPTGGNESASLASIIL